MRLAGCSLVVILALLGSAAAQEKPQPSDQVETETPQNETDADAAKIMERSLPFLDGQVLRYYNGKGQLEGFARRRHLTIRFYDAAGAYVGRAERVSQAATAYYAADGSYLGRRLHKRLVLKTTEHAYDRGPPAPDQPTGGE